MKAQIALNYRRSVVLPVNKDKVSLDNSTNLAATLSASMMELGFVPSQELFASFNLLDQKQAKQVYGELITNLRKLKGADVEYNPMYPNFPQQVMEMSSFELYVNAIIHYWTFGAWMPNYKKAPREICFEHTQFKEIGVISELEFDQIFNELLSANESLSDSDKQTIEWFVENKDIQEFDQEIPFKENLCFVAGLLTKQGKNIDHLIKTPTDILRIATALSGGDVSLAANTKFKSFPRSTRRILVRALEQVANKEDINRHRNKWIRLFHSLHVGEYSTELYDLAKTFRNNEHVETFNSRVQAVINNGQVDQAIKLLVQRPGEFARRLDHLLRLDTTKQEDVISAFLEVAKKESLNTRILLQVLGQFNLRDQDIDKRIVFPKGNTQRAVIVRKQLKALDKSTVETLQNGILNILVERFSKLDNLGKVWIDPQLMDCPIPTQQRSASEGLFQVARGTRLPFGDDKNTLRFFIYWVGRDIDLSATLHDENFEQIDHVSYTNLRSKTYQVYHSGDITSAPDGASEFIDITVDQATEHGVRYVTMNVMVYAGPTFSEHDKVYAGWMTRSEPNSNEIYDPKTVEQKIDLVSDSYNSVPVVFDLVERKAIWVDLTTSKQSYWGGNNVESNQASIRDVLESMIDLKNKVSLYELFMMHTKARGEIVYSKHLADTVFSLDGDITPYDISKINSEYLA